MHAVAKAIVAPAYFVLHSFIGFQASYLVHGTCGRKMEIRSEKYPSLGNQVDLVNTTVRLKLQA